MTVKRSSSDTAHAALPQTIRGPREWKTAAARVLQRHRYWCTPTDHHCNHAVPHKHGVECDYTCLCKGQS